MPKKPGEQEDFDDLDMVDHTPGGLDDEDDREEDDLEEDLEDEDEDDSEDEDEDDDSEDEDEDEDEDDDEDEDEDEGDDEDDDFADIFGDTPKRKKKLTAKERISELTRERNEERRARYEAELAAQAATARAPADQQEEKPLVAPDPGSFDYGEYDPKYLEAQADYLAEKKFRERMQETAGQRAQETEQQQQEHYRRKVEDVMTKGAKKFDDFAETVGTTNFDPALARLVLDSDMAVDISYYLSNNLKALRRITAMTPTDRARAIGRLEGRISAPSAVRKKSKAPETPGSRNKSKRKPRKSEAKYGPDNQDEFDKAFFQLN